MVFIYGILDGALTALHLVGLAVGLVQAFQFLVSNRHYGAVARMEVHANGIVYDFEILQIGAFRKLILAFHIYIVHQDVLVRTYQREDAGTFYSFFRLLLIIFRRMANPVLTETSFIKTDFTTCSIKRKETAMELKKQPPPP